MEARFDRPVTRISARSDRADDVLLRATHCETGNRIRTQSRWFRLPSAGIRCLRYEVDLAAAARLERVSSILNDDNIAVSPTAWLWRPRLRNGDTLTARFSLAADHDVYVPWRRIDGDQPTFELRTSPQSGSATAVFGEFESDVATIDGVPLRVVLLNTGRPIDFDAIMDWMHATGDNILQAYGRFPNPDASVLLIPVGQSGWSNSPIPFGRVVRDGGETIELLINERRPVSDYYDEWTPTHEFSHLMVPYLEREHRWISEGFAQYYQNVLLARAGEYSEKRAWEEIVAGLERGRGSSRHLSPNAAALNRGGGSRMKFYWSGAAIALLADVQLRRETNNAQSLDSALGELADCCLPSDRKWTGPELFARLDRLTETSVFMDLFREHADAVGFPDTGAVLDDLGVNERWGRVSFDDSAPLTDIREAITGPGEPRR